MEEILINIYQENEFEVIMKKDEYTFLQKKNQSYFFIAKYEEKELEDFFTSNKTDKMINELTKFSETNEDVSKNTSLIIYVKTDDLDVFFENNKKIIYKIEEDEYYFRKYVIVYTDESIKEIKNSKNINESILNIVLEPGRMDKFEEKYYEDEEYFFVMQLYIKLSFLIYEKRDEPFKSIQKRISEDLAKKKLLNQYHITYEWLSKKNIILDEAEQGDNDEGEKDFLKKLEESFFNTEKDEEILLNFFDGLEE